jgi:hypothetical protein
VWVLVQQEGETKALDVMVGGGFPPHDGTGFHQEVFRKHRTKGRPGASHGGLPFPGGKKDPSIGCLL